MSDNYRIWFNWAGVESTIYEPPEDLAKIHVDDCWFPCLHWNPNGIDFVVTMPNAPENLEAGVQTIHAGVNFDILVERFLNAERTMSDIRVAKARRKALCATMDDAMAKLTTEPFRCRPQAVLIA